MNRPIIPEREWRAQREVDRHDPATGPEPRYISSRKMPMVLDEDLGKGVVEVGDKRFKVTRPRRGIEDPEIWEIARRAQALLVTGNSTDFWLDRRFPIEQCAGLLVLVGNTDEERIRSFRHAIAKVWNLLYGYRRDGTSRFMMVKATPRGSIKFYGLGEDGQIVDFEI